jgi:hypothetical protein
MSQQSLKVQKAEADETFLQMQRDAAQTALFHLRKAYELLRLSGSLRARATVRRAMKSTEGAVRHAFRGVK